MYFLVKKQSVLVLKRNRSSKTASKMHRSLRNMMATQVNIALVSMMLLTLFIRRSFGGKSIQVDCFIYFWLSKF